MKRGSASGLRPRIWPPPSPRHERQCRTGSLGASSRRATMTRANVLLDMRQMRFEELYERRQQRKLTMAEASRQAEVEVKVERRSDSLYLNLSLNLNLLLVRSACVHSRSRNHNRHDPTLLLVAAIVYEHLFDIILCFLIGRDLTISIHLAFARVIGSQG